jgi:hypothetical protein
MEKKEDKEDTKVIIDINRFFLIGSQVSSDFFNQLFKEAINKIIIKNEKEDPCYIFIDIIFNHNTANYFNIVHGGSVALLFENIIHMILFYLTKNIYNTKDINIIYKRQVLLNVEYTLKIKIEKIKYKTIFIHCNLFKSKNNNEESAEANIIVEKEIINKI